ncbi:hypothetical protein DMI80_03490 [Akkermansia muciniphila]|nr:hypothetical protein DMI78_03480 [Akkermansia muciniphila]QHV69952.1 hypothetical protein DMI80_03490 [Akkermansia muciniphila]QHV72404.1 hypothetical protein DMI81_03485 [Akkermansia muciniphila]
MTLSFRSQKERKLFFVIDGRNGGPHTAAFYGKGGKPRREIRSRTMPFLLYGKCSGGDMQFWPEQYSFLGPVLNPFFPFVGPQVTGG